MWYKQPVNYDDTTGGTHIVIDDEARHDTVAIVFGEDRATLIAAAPELYDALRDAETILDRVVLHKDFDINPDVIRDIKSALAKAEST